MQQARDIVADYPLLGPAGGRRTRARQPSTATGCAGWTRRPTAQVGECKWLTGTVFGGPTAQAFHSQVHAVGRLLLLTGDLAAYSSARRAGSPATFKQLFPGGSWAAWVPLSVHLYDDGAGTRPD